MTVTFPRPSKMLIPRSQGGGSMRSTVKLNLADELHFEFVPTEVTILSHAAPSSTAGPRGRCPQNEVLHASSAVLSQRIARSSGWARSFDHHRAARYLHCHDVRVVYWTNQSRFA